MEAEEQRRGLDEGGQGSVEVTGSDRGGGKVEVRSDDASTEALPEKKVSCLHRETTACYPCSP